MIEYHIQTKHFNNYALLNNTKLLFKGCSILTNDNLFLRNIFFIIFNTRHFFLLLFQGSRDNMSIVLVLFPGAPSPSPEAIEAEKELDASLENHIKGCFNFSNCTNV